MPFGIQSFKDFNFNLVPFLFITAYGLMVGFAGRFVKRHAVIIDQSGRLCYG